MKRTLIIICSILFLFGGSAGTATAFELEDLLLNLYSIDGTQGITVAGGSITTGWSFPLDVAGREINSSIQSEISNLTLNSSVASFSVEIDPVTGLPLVTTEALGPIYAERAKTLGQGIFKFGASATYIEFTEFEGDDLDNLTAIIPHADFFPFGGELNNPPFEADLLRIDLDIEVEEYVVALYASYGIADNMDASIIVPFVDLDMEIDAHATILNPDGTPSDPNTNTEHRFDDPDAPWYDGTFDGDIPDDAVSGDASGIGDIIFRLKYFWKETEWADVAFAADLKVPTGDKENLLGADSFTLTPFVILSKTMYDGRFNPHVNFGYEIFFDDDEFSQLKYLAGFDSRVTKQVSFALDIIGNNELSGDGVGDDLWDVSAGLKFNPWRDLVFFANVQVPLNDEGLRADYVPSIGAEYSF